MDYLPDDYAIECRSCGCLRSSVDENGDCWNCHQIHNYVPPVVTTVICKHCKTEQDLYEGRDYFFCNYCDRKREVEL